MLPFGRDRDVRRHAQARRLGRTAITDGRIVRIGGTSFPVAGDRPNQAGYGRHHANPVVAGVRDIHVPVWGNGDAGRSVEFRGERRLQVAVESRSARACEHDDLAGLTIDAADAVAARIGHVHVTVAVDGHCRRRIDPPVRGQQLPIVGVADDRADSHRLVQRHHVEAMNHAAARVGEEQIATGRYGDGTGDGGRLNLRNGRGCGRPDCGALRRHTQRVHAAQERRPRLHDGDNKQRKHQPMDSLREHRQARGELPPRPPPAAHGNGRHAGSERRPLHGSSRQTATAALVCQAARAKTTATHSTPARLSQGRARRTHPARRRKRVAGRASTTPTSAGRSRRPTRSRHLAPPCSSISARTSNQPQRPTPMLTSRSGEARRPRRRRAPGAPPAADRHLRDSASGEVHVSLQKRSSVAPPISRRAEANVSESSWRRRPPRQACRARRFDHRRRRPAASDAPVTRASG